MDIWSGRRILFSGGGVGDNTQEEHGRFFRCGLIYWERSLLVRRLTTSSLLRRLTRRGGVYI